MLKRIWENIVAGLVTTVIIALVVLIGQQAYKFATDGSLIELLGGIAKSDVENLATKDDIEGLVTTFAVTSVLANRTAVGLNELKGRRLSCEALPREDEQKPASCSKGFKLAEWCSGNCDKDDARVTLCCDYRQE